MKRWNVTVPVAGHIILEVEADSEKEAIETALGTEWSHDDIQELESFRKLVEGNVCHPWVTESSAEELDDEGEDDD